MSWPTLHGAAQKETLPLYRVWRAMKARCFDPASDMFPRYGGRGIGVCATWRDDPAAFVDWALANGYAPGLSIDRMDNDADYGPGNCRWATPRQQAQNTSRTRLITWRGRTMCMADWARETGIHQASIQVRLDRCGWTVERALTEEPKKRLRRRKEVA